VAELWGRPDNHSLELTGRAVGDREAILDDSYRTNGDRKKTDDSYRTSS
jgi:hypothetical protein